MAFVTSDTDVAVCLQWKQPHFPVFVKLTSQGSVKESVDFIKSNNLLGLFVDHDLLMRVPKLVDAVKEAGSMIIADNNDTKTQLVGVDGIANDSHFYCYTSYTSNTVI